MARAAIITAITCLAAADVRAAEPASAPATRPGPVEIARRVEEGQRALVRMHAKSLASPYWVRRCFGVQALGDIRHSTATDRLIEAAKDPDPRVAAFVLLELIARPEDVPPDAEEALGKAVDRVVEGNRTPRLLQLALLAAERLPVAPKDYRPVWKRAYATIRDPYKQAELADSLINVIRTRADTTLVDMVVKRARRAGRTKSTRDTEFLTGLFGTTPGDRETWTRWWGRQRAVYDFDFPVTTSFATAIDEHVQSKRDKHDPEHGTREYYEQFEVYLGALHAAGLDVVFVFDSTGSMQPLINQVKANIRLMADLLANVTRETRIGLVTYRDTDDAASSYVTRAAPLTTKTDKLEKWMRQIRAGGGGDAPEAVLAGIGIALEKNRWGTKSKRIITLIGDAPPHGEDRPKLKTLCAQAAKKGFVINTIALGHEGASPETASAKPGGADSIDLLALGTRLTFQEIAAWGGGEAIVQHDTARVIADMLKTAFRPEWKDQIDRFVEAYLLLMSPSEIAPTPEPDRPRRPSRIRRRLLGVP